MSLLDGPDTVLVQLRVQGRDARKATTLTDSGAPVRVRGVTVRALSDVELNSPGLEVFSQKVVVSRTWPGDVLSQVIWGGYEWDTIGQPAFFPGSRSTRHYEIRIERRGVHNG